MPAYDLTDPGSIATQRQMAASLAEFERELRGSLREQRHGGKAPNRVPVLDENDAEGLRDEIERRLSALGR